jgi:hypothetical protein
MKPQTKILIFVGVVIVLFTALAWMQVRSQTASQVSPSVTPPVAEQLSPWSDTLPIRLPILLVSCTNCGYIAQHAARLLDLKR